MPKFLKKKFLNTFLRMGILGTILGGLTFGGVFAYLILNGTDAKTAYTISLGLGSGAAAIGFWIDCKYEVSQRIHNYLWISRLKTAKNHLENKYIHYRSALITYYNASYHLSQPSIFLRGTIEEEGDELKKEILDSQIWAVKYALPHIDKRIRPEGEDVFILENWLPIVDELQEIYLQKNKPKSVLGRVGRFVNYYLLGTDDNEDIAREVVSEYNLKHLKKLLEREDITVQLEKEEMECLLDISNDIQKGKNFLTTSMSSREIYITDLIKKQILDLKEKGLVALPNFRNGRWENQQIFLTDFAWALIYTNRLNPVELKTTPQLEAFDEENIIEARDIMPKSSEKTKTVD